MMSDQEAKRLKHSHDNHHKSLTLLRLSTVVKQKEDKIKKVVKV